MSTCNDCINKKFLLYAYVPLFPFNGHLPLNRWLKVGEDLTEAEAKVLMEYGWVPYSGLGTMLNYCDRVVHDRKNEKDSSEWRSKIAKLLMDGYNGGTMVATDIPKKDEDYIGSPKREIKSEF